MWGDALSASGVLMSTPGSIKFIKLGVIIINVGEFYVYVESIGECHENIGGYYDSYGKPQLQKPFNLYGRF